MISHYRKFHNTIIPWLLLLLPGCINNSDSTGSIGDPDGGFFSPDTIQPTIVRTIPHDTTAFTQGLLYHQGYLYESTGRYGASSLRKINLPGGDVVEEVAVADMYFAEGLAQMDGHLVQLTWQQQIAFVYALPAMEVIDTLYYSGQGWGLTSDDRFFIMSDGSEKLFYRDERFRVISTRTVTLAGEPLVWLNELEYVDGVIYANVWKRPFIYVIDSQSGKVKQVIDCAELVSIANPDNEAAVLNGIAYNARTGTFYCTGKLWPYIFEITLE